MGEGLVLDLGDLLTQEKEATQGPQESSLAIKGSDWAFIDGDTIFNSVTGKSIRLDGIDTRETAKFIKEKPYSESEIGADSAAAYIAGLANEYGFNHNSDAWYLWNLSVKTYSKVTNQNWEMI